MRLSVAVIAMAFALVGAASRGLAADASLAAVDGVPGIVTHVCASCHGRDGNSRDASVPSLAGQGRAYLERQLAAFKAQRRVGVMSGIAMALGDADVHAAAAYFAQQIAKPDARATIDPAQGKLGETIYRDGIEARSVPACASCHALDGAGLLPEFPRLAGQQSDYVAEQLRAFRSGRRLSNPNAMMRALSAKLSDEDIEAVADYIARMR